MKLEVMAVRVLAVEVAILGSELTPFFTHRIGPSADSPPPQVGPPRKPYELRQAPGL